MTFNSIATKCSALLHMVYKALEGLVFAFSTCHLPAHLLHTRCTGLPPVSGLKKPFPTVESLWMLAFLAPICHIGLLFILQCYFVISSDIWSLIISWTSPPKYSILFVPSWYILQFVIICLLVHCFSSQTIRDKGVHYMLVHYSISSN